MRKVMMTTLAASMLLAFQGTGIAEEGMINSAANFKKNCKICHKLDKKGMGPAILSMSTDPIILTKAITNGRKAMPSFTKKLSTEEIKAMVKHLLALKKQQDKH